MKRNHGVFFNNGGLGYYFSVDDFSLGGITGSPMEVVIKGHVVSKSAADPEDTQKKDVKLKRVIFAKPATIAFWSDGTKTVVKCGEGDVYSEKIGLALCYLKKFTGNRSRTLDDIVRGKCERVKSKKHVTATTDTDTK